MSVRWRTSIKEGEVLAGNAPYISNRNRWTPTQFDANASCQIRL